MRRAIIAAVLLALFLYTGCSYSVKLDPNIDPTANISNKIDYDVGVFVPQSVKKARIADSSDWAPSTRSRSAWSTPRAPAWLRRDSARSPLSQDTASSV